MNDLEDTRHCLGRQIEHKFNGIFIHQSKYTKKTLISFDMNFTH